MGRPKLSEQRDTRRDILDAALEVFSEQGFHGAGLREIARAAGVRESAIYHHFPNKEALFDAVLHDGIDEVGRMMKEIVDGPMPDDLQPFLERLLTAALERFATLRERKRFRLFMSESLRLHRAGQEEAMQREFAPKAEMRRLMQRLVKEKKLVGDPEFLAHEIIAPAFFWRQVQEMSPRHRFVTDYRTFLRLHVEHFLKAAENPEPPIKLRARLRGN